MHSCNETSAVLTALCLFCSLSLHTGTELQIARQKEYSRSLAMEQQICPLHNLQYKGMHFTTHVKYNTIVEVNCII